MQAVAHRGNDCYTCEERLCLAVDSSPIQLTGHLKRPDSSVVERGPEKAGVGGSIPSLATTSSSKEIQRHLKPSIIAGFFSIYRPWEDNAIPGRPRDTSGQVGITEEDLPHYAFEPYCNRNRTCTAA